MYRIEDLVRNLRIDFFCVMYWKGMRSWKVCFWSFFCVKMKLIRENFWSQSGGGGDE